MDRIGHRAWAPLAAALRRFGRVCRGRTRLLTLGGVLLLAASAALFGLATFTLLTRPHSPTDARDLLRDSEIILSTATGIPTATPTPAPAVGPRDDPYIDLPSFHYPGGDGGRRPPLVADMKIVIDAIRVRAPVVPMGMASRDHVQVPDTAYEVAWYDFSAPPGSGSNAIFAAHVTWERNFAIFWNLKDLRLGDQIEIIGGDGSRYVYEVFDKLSLDPDDPEGARLIRPTHEDILTLITCGGTFLPDPDEPLGGHYDQRIVVRARLVEADSARL